MATWFNNTRHTFTKSDAIENNIEVRRKCTPEPSPRAKRDIKLIAKKSENVSRTLNRHRWLG